LAGLAMEDVGICMTFLCSLRPNGIFYGHLVNFCGHLGIFFSRFGMWYREKSGNPAGRKGLPMTMSLQRPR
jgi:hypothetical protein